MSEPKDTGIPYCSGSVWMRAKSGAMSVTGREEVTGLGNRNVVVIERSNFGVVKITTDEITELILLLKTAGDLAKSGEQ